LRPAGDLAGSVEALADWDAGRVADRFPHGRERDFMEWEALVMERQDRLDLIRELSASVNAAS
jgi:hypothetical protein